MRDLGMARTAYSRADAGASKQAHLITTAQEHHKKGGDFIKNIVFGGLDGIITTFAVVSGATGGGLGVDVILILGFSNIFADALSMGVGDALSSKAEHEYIRAERRREAWEFTNFPEGEVKEMVDLYMSKGMEREDAELVIKTMAKYEDFFVDVMMLEELELVVPADDENPWVDGAVTFSAFVVFGLVPLLSYAIFQAANLDLQTQDLFIIACVLTVISLFVLGAIKSKFSTKPWWRGGLEIMTMGSFTAATAYFIGWFVNYVALGDSGQGTLH